MTANESHVTDFLTGTSSEKIPLLFPKRHAPGEHFEPPARSPEERLLSLSRSL